MTDERLEEIARYYLDKKVSINELSHIFKISKSSIVRYFDGERQIKLSHELQRKVDDLKRQNWIDGKSTSGNTGNKILDPEQIINIARIYAAGDYTLRELADIFKVSPTTLYNNFTIDTLGNDLYVSVNNIYEKNKETKRRK